ncbi:Hsp20/alpha crystallin family protein [Geomesophilobacter sediminis]|uniref:Hsp20/alpha crystallin family protein n=1 Tax=Geomesophilobacter sediminis TaxID=2798584 RepID=A0A8J7M057_9BACT|nr:Hsp20/alpha crystallin family protein [Geomesophilobacter sediminis]MBJ6723447.1 Hsp20/alpha crystallin family protein [Geomesophilobacter sediminis]
MLEKERDVQKRSDQPLDQWRRQSPFAEMDRLFDEVFKRPFFSLMSTRTGGATDQLYLPVDIFEDGESIVVKAEIPGIRKEDIDVQLTPDSITISGHRDSEEKVERKNYLRLERSHGSFTRRFDLPVETLVDKARATFKDGILEVRIPKSEHAQERVRKVTID